MHRAYKNKTAFGTPEAGESIGDYIAQENTNAAYNVLIRIKAAVDTGLKLTPHYG
ncbi:MAG: hypothetical protein IPO71_14365 [Nitrosomonas sp.]|nr:hypothetical protein [Nitrosomonas sp.]